MYVCMYVGLASSTTTVLGGLVLVSYHDGHVVVHEDHVVFLHICESCLDRLQPVLHRVHLQHPVSVQQRLQHLAVGSHIYKQTNKIMNKMHKVEEHNHLLFVLYVSILALYNSN